MEYDNEVDGYTTPTKEQIAARTRRNYALGGVMLLFCILIFALMVVRIGGGI